MEKEKLIPFQIYSEQLKAAVQSGSSGLLELVLDKIVDYDPDLIDPDEIGNLHAFDGVTLAQYVANAGKDELFQWIANCGYGCTDLNVMAAARKLVTTKAALSTQQAYFKTIALVHTLRDKHRLTGRYYVMLHQYLIYLPGLVISTAAAILAFVSTAKQISQETSSGIVLCVGALSIITALLQTVSDQLQLNGRGLQHTSAADELAKIMNDLEFGQTTGDDLLAIKDRVHNIGKTCRYQMHTTMEALFDELVGEMCELRELASREVGYAVPLEEAADRRRADTNAVWSAISNDAYWPWTLRTGEIKAAVMRELRSDTLRLLSAHRKVAPATLEADANMDVSAILRELYKHKAEAQQRQQASAQALGSQWTLSGSPDGKFYGGPPLPRAGRRAQSPLGGRRRPSPPPRPQPKAPQYEHDPALVPDLDPEDDGEYENLDEVGLMEAGAAVPVPAFTPTATAGKQLQHGALVAKAAMKFKAGGTTAAASSGNVTPKGPAVTALFNKLNAEKKL